MKISFATTCSDKADSTLRTDHLKQTLTQNMRDNPVRAGSGHELEFAVLNYNSKNDALHDWIMTDPRMVDAMQSGLLRYGHNTDAPQFRMSHAKNQAHRLSTGDFVCNVDADNFTGPRFAQYLANIFREEPNALVDPSLRIKRSVGGGLYGRVALSRENFMNLGGYDEGFKGWGGEEVDMIHRAKGLGIRNYYIDDEFRLRVIQHSDEERVVNMFSDETDRAREVSKIFQIHHDARNIFVRRWDRVANIFGAMARGTQVNNGEFGMGRLLVGPQEVPMVLGPVDVDPSMNKRTGLGYPLESFIARWKPETRTVISVPGEGHEGEAFLPGHFAHS